MKLWRKLTILWIAAALIYILWGAAIILKGGSYETAKSATFPMNVIVVVLIYISVFTKLKDKGWFEYRHDERTKKISSRVFTYSWLATFLFVGLRLINEIIFTALMGPVFAIASVLYVLLFYRYEKGINENEN